MFHEFSQNSIINTISQDHFFLGYGDIDIASNNNLNVLGSMLSSVNGNVTLAAANDIKIEAGTNTLLICQPFFGH